MSPNVQIKSIYHGYTILYNMLVKMLFHLCTPFLEHRLLAVLFVGEKRFLWNIRRKQSIARHAEGK